MAIVGRSLKKAHDLLNYDFCPWANRWVYWMRHPLACLGAAAIVAGFCGFFVNPMAFVMLGGILFAGLLGVIWPWTSICGLSAEAQFMQTRCRVGQSVLVKLRIVNRLPWPVWGLSIRKGFHDLPGELGGIALARVRGWSETEFEWLFTPPRRGVYPLSTESTPQKTNTSSARAETGFPFGLWHASVPISVRNELVVWPESVVLDAMPDAAEIHSREDRFTDRRSGYFGDMVGIRPFRDGDSLRRVHWQQTARTGRLIVVERQAPATCAIRLVVDVDRRRHLVKEGVSSLEQSLSVVASVLESLHRHHAFVELQVHEQIISVGESQGELRRGLDALSRVPMEGVPCHHSCHFDHPTRKLPTIAVTTDRALAHHRGHRHISIGERFIVIRTESVENAEKSQPGCDCHAWIELMPGEKFAEVLPDRWRRGCHGAW